MEHVWEWFWQLSATRSRGFGTEPLKPTDIEAWARLSATEVRPEEFSMLLEMDEAYLSESAKEAKSNQPAQPESTPTTTSRRGRRR